MFAPSSFGSPVDPSASSRSVGRTLSLGRWAGVAVSAHWTTLITTALITVSVGASLLPAAVPDVSAPVSWSLGVLAALAFLASLVAHELGHAVVARRAGVATRGITLWMFGGVSHLERRITSPSTELRVAAAGPAVSASLATAFGLGAYLIDLIGSEAPLAATLAGLAWMNLLLTFFNLLPALPLDGGRMLRAWQWKRHGDEFRAGRTAARVGRIVGMTTIALGVMAFGTGGGLMVFAVGLVLLSSARSEREQIEFRSSLSSLTVADATDAQVPVVRPELTLDRLASEVFPQTQRTVAAVHDGANVVGLITIDHLRAVPVETWTTTTVGDVCWAAAGARGVAIANPGQPLMEALELPADRPQGYLLVFDGKFIGVVVPALVQLCIVLRGFPSATADPLRSDGGVRPA